MFALTSILLPKEMSGEEPEVLKKDWNFCLQKDLSQAMDDGGSGLRLNDGFNIKLSQVGLGLMLCLWPGSGTIRTKTSSSWDNLLKITIGTVRLELLGRFTQNLIYWDNSPFLIFKRKNKLLRLSFHLF